MNILLLTSKSGFQSGGGGQKYNRMLERILTKESSVERVHYLPESNTDEISLCKNVYVPLNKTIGWIEDNHHRFDLIISSTGATFWFNQQVMDKLVFVKHTVTKFDDKFRTFSINRRNKISDLIMKAECDREPIPYNFYPLVAQNVVYFVKENRIVNNKKYWCIPIGVEHKKLLNVEKKDICFVGRLNKTKGIKVLDRINTNLNIFAYGEKEGNISIKNIEYKGYTTSPIEIFNEHKYSLLASKHEGFPIAIIESIYAGCIPIISNTFENANYFIDNEVVYEAKRNGRSFSEAIKFLENNKSLREKLLKNMAKFSEEVISFKKFEENWMSVVREFDLK